MKQTLPVVHCTYTEAEKEPRRAAGGVFSALSYPHPCDTRDACCTMFAMSGCLFQGGTYVLRNKQPNGLPMSHYTSDIEGG